MSRSGTPVRRRFAGLAVFFLFPAFLSARPLLTEPVQTVGRFHFESGFSISQREDKFGTPENTLETVVFPFFATFGASRKLDIGLSIRHVGQRLDVGSVRFTGSRTGQVALHTKYAFNDFFGLQLVWETSSGAEDKNQDLPVVRGNNVEANLLVHAGTAWPLTLNVGNVWRGDYKTDFGVKGGEIKNVDPGRIFQVKAAVEIPLLWRLSALGEAVYYEIGNDSINARAVTGSDGNAMDLLAGVNWAPSNWNIGAGVAFGILDESHTSFGVDRGAGDWKAIFRLAYNLEPKRPESYR